MLLKRWKRTNRIIFNLISSWRWKIFPQKQFKVVFFIFSDSELHNTHRLRSWISSRWQTLRSTPLSWTAGTCPARNLQSLSLLKYMSYVSLVTGWYQYSIQNNDVILCGSLTDELWGFPMSVNTNVKFANQIVVTSVLTEECQTNRHYRINMLASRRPQ